MKTRTFVLHGVAWLIAALLAVPAVMLAQDTGGGSQEYRFSKEELTQMLAPIALYPDALTAQILMASTYPLEVVEADRWRSRNSELQGDELDAALKDKPWDPSVKSLCHFPSVLAAMSDKLDQTRKLGDAFLSQEDEVMATIQELRRRAREQGHLRTTSEQRVLVEGDLIRIEPAQRDVVYVPVYDPVYVYGPWWYPAYPPYYWYYPSGFYGGVSIGFAPGIYIGWNVFTWAWFDWPVHRIYIDTSRARHFHRFDSRRGEPGPFWRHSPYHRRGVAYRDPRTSQQFGVRQPRSGPAMWERRGYPGVRTPQQGPAPVVPQGIRQTVTPPRGSAPAVPQGGRQTTPQAAPSPRQELIAPRTPFIQPKLLPGRPAEPRKELRDTPFRGIGEGSFERKAGERGGSSNRGMQIKQQDDDSRGAQPQRGQGGGGGGGGGGVIRRR